MAVLTLTRGHSALIDDSDLAELSQWKWTYMPRSCGHGGYAVRYETKGGTRRTIYMHRQIMEAAPGELVDHEDGNGLNNQRYNLRLSSTSLNNVNKAAPARAIPYRGVYANGPTRTLPFKAQIKAFRQNRHLGDFATQEAAARAYDRAAIHFFGSFARLNFPDEIEQTRALPLARSIARRLAPQLLLPLDEPQEDFPTPAPRRPDWLEINYFRNRPETPAAPLAADWDDGLL